MWDYICWVIFTVEACLW